MNPAPAYELRVLSGEQSGATSTVCSGDTLRIGRDWSSDVVLQQADDSAALLIIDANGQLTLNVDAGQCMVDGGAELQAGEHASFAPYTSFTVGGVRMAVGRIGASQWAPLFDDAKSEATADVDSAVEASPQESPQAPAGIWQIWSAAILLVQHLSWVKRLLLGGAVLVSASTGALTLAWAMSTTNLPLPRQADNLRQVLADSGFKSLGVETSDNELVVTGYLDTLAQKSQLDQLLAKLGGKTPRLAAWTNEQVTADVGDVYRLNHIAAEVHSAGPGIVSVQTHEGDAAALEKVKAFALSNVPNLRQLVAINHPPAAAACGATTIHDPNKLIVAIVPGDPAYVVTADGTRYFEGAMLPTGYFLKAIMPGHIQMECDGVISDLKL